MALFLMAFLATLIGAMSGLGGGVIIKPILDLFGVYDAATANMLSAFTVLAMAVSSVAGHIRMKTKFHYETTIPLALGAVGGGILGDWLLLFFIQISKAEARIIALQNICLLFLLLLVLLYMSFFKEKVSFRVKNIGVKVLLGLILGMISTFVGIGGGPVNIMFLTLFFSLDAKAASVSSLVMILFSQIAKLASSALTVGFAIFDLKGLWFMIPGGVMGGILGAIFNRRMKEGEILRLFYGVLGFILLVTVVNIFLKPN